MAKKNVLICDDEEGIRESFRLILEKEYDLTFASDGTKAVELIRTKPFDLVIMDIKMPRMDGIETMQNLRKICPGLKILVTSGYKSVETAREAVAAGASNYVVKPFERAEILTEVKRLIR